MEQQKSLIERIKEIRKAKGFTTSVLAEAVGIEQSTLSCYELGYRQVTADMAEQMLNAMGCEIEIVDYPLPKPSRDRLMTILQTQIAEDIVELQFLTDYERAKSEAGKRKVIAKYAADYYEQTSERPTIKDMGVSEIDTLIVGSEKKPPRKPRKKKEKPKKKWKKPTKEV